MESSRTVKVAGFLALLVVAVAAALWWGSGRSADEPVTEVPPPDVRASVSVEPLRPGAVSGLVVARDRGTRLVGASVALLARPVPGEGSGQPTEVKPRVVSPNDDGEWSFADVQPGHYQLTATAVGFEPAVGPAIEVGEGADVEGVVLVLAPGGHLLEGTISDALGGAIEGATIAATSAVRNSGDDPGPGSAYATASVEGGRYRLQLSPGVYTVSVRHPDYSGVSRLVWLEEGPRTEDFALVPGASIEGVVRRTTDGKPVANAAIVYSPAMDAMRDAIGIRVRTNQQVQAKSDESGRFRLSGLPPGIIQLEAFAARYGSTEPTDVPIGVAQTVRGIELWVDPMSLVSGVVLWSDTGEPVTGALVTMMQRAPPTFMGADQPTGEDGRFRVSAVPAGTYSASARGVGIASSSSVEVVASTEDLTGLEIRVERGMMLRGRVDPPGAADVVAAAKPSLGGILSDNRRRSASAAADDDGSFALTALAAGSYVVIAKATDGTRGTIEVELPSDEEVVVHLEPRSSVAGTVVDTNGQPVDRTRVCMSPKDRSVRAVDRLTSAPSCVPGRPNGEFEIRGLAGGTYEVSVTHSALATPVTFAEGSDREVDVPLRAAVDGITVVVEPPDGRIEGAVVGPDGEPISDAWIIITPQPDEERNPVGRALARRLATAQSAGSPTLVDSEGRFEIGGLVRGTYLVMAEGGAGTLRAELAGVNTDADVVLQMRRVGVLTGRVIAPGGLPEHFSVRTIGPTITRRRFAGSDGEFTLSNMTPGTYDVIARADGLVGRAGAELSPGTEASVQIELASLGTVTGRAVDPDGSPLAGVGVRVSSADAEPDLSEFLLGGDKTGKDGRFEVSGVEPGKGSVSLREGGRFSVDGAYAFETFTMQGGDTIDVGDIIVQTRKQRDREMYKDRSEDLGLRFYAGESPPTAEGLAQIDEKPSKAMDHLTNRAAKLWIAEVVSGGVGERAGFQVGDRIVQVGRMKVEGMAAGQVMMLSEAWRSKGRPVVFQIERDGTLHDLEVVVPK